MHARPGRDILKGAFSGQLDAAVFRAAVQNAVEAIVICGPDGIVRFANRAVEPVLGWQPDDLVGRNIAVIMGSGDSAAHDGHLQRYLAGGPARIIGVGREVTGRRKDGAEVALDLSIAEVGLGEEVLFAAVMRDVTERRRTAEALARAKALADQSARAKSAFMANTSHELRTPLNAIIGFAEVIEQELYGPLHNEQYSEAAGLVRRSGQQLLALFNNILDLARIEMGDMRLELELLNTDDLLAGALEAVRDAARAGDVALCLDTSGAPARLRADRGAIRRILVHLLSNAVKFSRPGGRVRLTAGDDGSGGIVITVADTGLGMDPAQVPAALEPFVQVSSGLDRRFEGAGLGLPIARALTDLHGGGLEIASAPGEGTRVVIRLPGSDCPVSRTA